MKPLELQPLPRHLCVLSALKDAQYLRWTALVYNISEAHMQGPGPLPRCVRLYVSGADGLGITTEVQRSTFILGVEPPEGK
jgi:hypothetical protein